MRREVSLEEISDGRLYELNDMVKADCQDCAGCHDCCEGMGDSVVLDPMDVYRLCTNLGKTPQELVSTGLILDFAGFSRWDATMKTEASSIFCRSMNVRRQAGARSR